MRRTVSAKTYRKWLIWLSVFAGLMLGLWISAAGIRLAYADDSSVLPIYWRGLLALEKGMKAAFIILAVAWCAVMCAMIISAALGIAGILKDPEEYVWVPKSQVKKPRHVPQAEQKEFKKRNGI